MSPVPDLERESMISEQRQNEAAYRQLMAQGVLAVLLPTEELENVCIRTLIADVIAEIFMGNLVGGKACESRFVWNTIIKTVEMIQSGPELWTTDEERAMDGRNRLEKYGLVSDDGSRENATGPSHPFNGSKAFWQIIQYGYFAFCTLRFMVIGLVAASSRTSRASSTPGISNGVASTPMTKTGEAPPALHRAVVQFRIFPLLSVLVDLPRRMPWLSGCFSLLQHQLIHGPLRVGVRDGLLDV